MAYAKNDVLQVRKPSIVSTIGAVVSINTLISGVMLLAICFLSLLTSRYDQWLPAAFMVAVALTVVGYVASVRYKKRTKSCSDVAG